MSFFGFVRGEDWQLREYAIEGNLDGVKRILHQQPELLTSIDRSGHTVLIKAIKYKQAEIVEFLVNKTEALAQLEEAIVSGEFDCNQNLGRRKTKGDEGPDGLRLLHVAAAMKFTEVASMLLRMGKILIGIQSEDGRTPLSLAMDNGHIEMQRILEAAPTSLPEAAAEPATPTSPAIASPIIIAFGANVLGRGASAVVYEGMFGARRVAVKRIMVNSLGHELVEKEVDILLTLEHSNIVRYLHHFPTEQHIDIALELCDMDLQAALEQRLLVPENATALEADATRLDICKQMAAGLRYLHHDVKDMRPVAAGAVETRAILHRDLKPQNVLLQRLQGGGWLAKLADMGVARVLTQTTASTFHTGGGGAGTLGWQAPELMVSERVKATRFSDIFSLGCLFYYMLATEYDEYGKLLRSNHPFGPEELRRPSNIMDNKFHIQTAAIGLGADHLIRWMLAHTPTDRPLMADVQGHVFFADALSICEEICQLSDHLLGASKIFHSAPSKDKEAILRKFEDVEDTFSRLGRDDIARSHDWRKQFLLDPATYDEYRDAANRSEAQRALGYMLGIPPNKAFMPSTKKGEDVTAGGYNLFKTMRNHVHHFDEIAASQAKQLLLAENYASIIPAEHRATEALRIAFVQSALAAGKSVYISALYMPFVMKRVPELKLCVQAAYAICFGQQGTQQLPAVYISPTSPVAAPPFDLDTACVLGWGASAIVFRGTFSGHPVAVKRLLASPSDLKLALNEVDALLHLNHQHIVRCYHHIETADALYIALELCDMDLARAMESGELRSPPSTALSISKQMAEGMHFLHHGVVHQLTSKSENIEVVVHGNLKPQNVLLQTLRGGEWRVKLANLGMAKAVSDDDTAPWAVTIGWMAPELLELGTKPAPTTASDVFSLGCLIYYVLSAEYDEDEEGKLTLHPFNHPFGAHVHIRAAKILSGEASIDATRIGPDAADLIASMVARDPSLRPTMVTVLDHPLFVPASQLLASVCIVSDSLEGKIKRFKAIDKDIKAQGELDKEKVSEARANLKDAKKAGGWNAVAELETELKAATAAVDALKAEKGAIPAFSAKLEDLFLDHGRGDVARSDEWRRLFLFDGADPAAYEALLNAKGAADREQLAELGYMLGLPPNKTPLPGSGKVPAAGGYNLLRTVRNHTCHFQDIGKDPGGLARLAQAYHTLLPADVASGPEEDKVAFMRAKLAEKGGDVYLETLYMPYILQRVPELNLVVWRFRQWIEGDGK